jgi:hypothetical protein
MATKALQEEEEQVLLLEDLEGARLITESFLLMIKVCLIWSSVDTTMRPLVAYPLDLWIL